MANAPPMGSSPRIAGTAAGTIADAVRNHATSLRLRPTGARQSAATFRRASARLTQNVPEGPSTRQMSDETPPLIGQMATGELVVTNFMRASESRTSRYTALPGGTGAALSA